MAAEPRSAALVVLVTAAGSSARFGGAKKELERLEDGRRVLDASISPFLSLPGLRLLALTTPPGREAELRAAVPGAAAALGDRLLVSAGGATRRDSVRLGLELLAAGLGPGEAAEALVLVHDGARPWASAELARRAALGAAERGSAIPVLPLAETPKEVEAGGGILSHPPRASLATAQTPQAFRLLPLLEAHRRALAEGVDCTDDAELWARYVGPASWIEGERGNLKITFRGDLAAGNPAPAGSAAPPAFRVGEGWDRHRLVAGRPLLLGGVELPSEVGEDAHSDGDVLLHAVVDALLGGAALGDIGTHFPPSDGRWKGADSREFACRAAALVRASGWEPVSLDCTVALERPRLGTARGAIRDAVARALGMDPDLVSIKAKTGEGVDAVGEGRAVEARAVVLLARAARG